MRRICLALLLVCAACEGKGKGHASADETAPSLEPAVSFEGKTTAGKTISLADYPDKVILVNVWASWCTPCKKELPELQKMHHAYGDDFLVLGISVDKPRNFKKVQQLMGQFGIDYPVVLDPDGDSTRVFGVQGYPTSILIDRNGVVRWRREGLIAPNDTEADTAIRAALEAG